MAPFSIIFSPLDFVLFQQIFPKKVLSLLPLLKTGGEEEASLLPSHFGIGGGFSPPLPKMGGEEKMGVEEGLRFRKSPELAAYSAAYSPKTRPEKLESLPATHFTETCFLDVLDLLITANAFLMSILCVFANEHLEAIERRK